MGKTVRRIRSTRAYRRMADEILIQMRRGEISSRDAKNMIDAIKGSCEMMMAENVMKANQIDDRETDHGLGEDGGLDDYRPSRKAKLFQRRRTTVKTGSSERKGDYREDTESVEK